MKLFVLVAIIVFDIFGLLGIDTPVGNIRISYLFIIVFTFIYLKEIAFSLCKDGRALARRLSKKEIITSFVIFIFFLIPVIFSENVGASIKWLFLLVFNLYSVYFVYFYLGRNSFNLLDIKRTYLLAFFIASLPSLIQKLFELLGYVPPFLTQIDKGFLRLNGLSLYPNFYTLYLILLVPTLLFLVKEGRAKSVVFGVLVFVVIEAGTRTGMLGMFVTLIVYFYFFRKTEKKMGRQILLVAVFFFTYMIVTNHISRNYYELKKHPVVEMIWDYRPINYIPRDSSRDSKSSFDVLGELNFLNHKGYSSTIHRIYIAKQGLAVLWDNFFIGVGPSPQSYADYVNRKLRKYVKYSYPSKHINYHHENIWIEVFCAFGGVLGLVLLLSLLLKIKTDFIRIKKSDNKLSLSMLISLSVYLFVTGQFVQNILINLPYVLLGFYLYSMGMTENSGVSELGKNT